MITIPLYAILFLYLAGALVFAALFMIDFFHLVHTGTFTLASFIVTFCALAATAIILWGTWYLLADVWWQAPLKMWDNAWFGSVFSTNQIFSPFQSP